MDALLIWVIASLAILPLFTPPSTAVIVNDSTRFRCNRSCSGVIKWVYGRMRSGIPVIECKQGSCSAGDAFKDRAEAIFSDGMLGLHLNPVRYNDGGKYICFCDDVQLCQQSLDVIAPIQMNAAAEENLTIPFYARTSKIITDRDIIYRCEKDGVLVVKIQNGKASYGPGFEGRVSMPLDKYKTGDLSLTIYNVQQSDGGTYYCTHRDEESVQPEAVTLSVTAAMSAKDVKSCSTPGAETTCWWLFGVLFSLVFFYVLFRIQQRKNCRTSKK